MMIAVVLSSNIKKMIRDQVLVRKAVGIEAAGSMDMLFTDKTGTLTEGKMSVGSIIISDGKTYDSARALKKSAKSVYDIYELSCRYNTASEISDGKVIGGNATDRALLESILSLQNHPSVEISILKSIPFDSDRKFSGVILSDKKHKALIKGAPEKLMPHIRYAYNKDGHVISFSSVSYNILKKTAELTSKGGRVLFLAEGDRLPDKYGFGELTFVCAVLLNDNIRPEAKRSVHELQNAGIRVIMITGDNRDTARAIAASCGILSRSSDIVITGDELAKISDNDLKKLLPKLSVVARALPSDKSRLVRVAQEMERVVGMTGDGINDAPALKRADVGFAMGTGTGVARDAGDIIILDNNLSSISKAVLYGRNIFKSIRKFITLQLTMNFCAVGVSMIGPFVGIDSPVTVVQMLWINIIMDTLGGLAFAGEAPLASCMKEAPKKRDEPILNRYMIDQILGLGGFTVALCMFFLLSPTISSHFRSTADRLCHMTAFFALFIFTSVLNCFNARSDRLRLFSGIAKNKTFIFIMLLICTVQIIFVYLGKDVLRTMPLSLSELGYTVVLAFSVFPAEFIRKLLWRMRGMKQGF